jgi:hypothetical protein
MSAALTFLFIFVGVGESAPDFTNVLGFQSGFQIKLMIARQDFHPPRYSFPAYLGSLLQPPVFDPGGCDNIIPIISAQCSHHHPAPASHR